ncbi:FAD-dependent oxidoreductase [Thiomicrorhabdus hydrogeniphila]
MDPQVNLTKSKVALPKMALPKIAILGAGLLGRMLTVSLMKDYQITLFDKDNGDAKQSAGYLAAAMLAPLAESADCDLKIMKMGEKALILWPEFIKKLSTPVFFQQAGSLIVTFDQDIASLKQFTSRLKGQDYSEFDLQQIQQLEPELNSRLKKGLFLPNEGQLDNRQLLEAMAIEIRKNDVVWHTDSMVKTTDQAVWVNNKKLTGYDWVIDCRGMGLQQDQTKVPIQSQTKHQMQSNNQLRGVRGEVIRVFAPDVVLQRPVRLMHPRYPIYIAPKEKHYFVIGATQLESEDQRKPTVRSALELLSACFSVHSGFAEAEIISIDAGLRPAYVNNHPKITKQKNRITINGLFRHGYLLAPVMVEKCVTLLKQEMTKQINTEQLNQELSFLPGLVKPQNSNLVLNKVNE